MKTLLYLIAFIALGVNAQTEISDSLSVYQDEAWSIAPSIGDRMDFFLNNGVWETELTRDSHFVLKVFIDHYTDRQSIFMLNLDMPVQKFEELMWFIGLMPSICIYGEGSMLNEKTGKYVLDSFDVSWCDEEPMRGQYLNEIGDTHKVDVFYLMDVIRGYLFPE